MISNKIENKEELSIRASIAMAVYNGEKYLREQLDSIIPMLSENDEIVISYDESQDGSYEIINEYVNGHRNIHCYKNVRGQGVSNNFTNAAEHCSGRYIFFSDQDDVWLGDKVNVMVNAFEVSKADLVIHNGYFTDSTLVKFDNSLFEMTKATTNPFLNFYKGRFLGCCMAFRRETMEYILPFPNVTSNFPHDIFATILVGLKGKIVMIPDCFILHRVHGGNETPIRRNPLPKVLRNRFILLGQLVKRIVSTSFKDRIRKE